MTRFLALAGGSLAGGLSRYAVAWAAHRALGSHFPWGTFVVNLTGCFLIGWLDAVAQHRFLFSVEARLLLMTGFCGAYTTFSALIMETDHLIKGGMAGYALANLGLSLVLGLSCFRLGDLLGRR